MDVEGTSGSLLELRCMIITNGSRYSGGGLAIVSSAQVSLVMCSIQQNEGISQGGGIYVTDSGTVLNLYGVSFSGNTAPENSGSDIKRGFGAITVHSTCSAGGDAAVQQSALSASGTVGGDLYSYTCLCSAGTHGPSIPCTPCAAGDYSGAAASTCSSCGAGKYLTNSATSSESSACTICAAGGYSGASAGYCKPCRSGKVLTDAGTDATLHDAESDCDDCEASTTSVAGSDSCVALTTHEVGAQVDLFNKVSRNGTAKMSNGDTVMVARGTYAAGSAHDSSLMFYLDELYGNIMCHHVCRRRAKLCT